jgi:replicative DNA helicase
MRSEIEQSLIFLAMSSPDTVALSGCTSDDFEGGTRRAVWRALQAMADEGKPLVTATALSQRTGLGLTDIEFATTPPTIIDCDPRKVEVWGRELREISARDLLLRGLERVVDVPPCTSQELAQAAMDLVNNARVITEEKRIDRFDEAEELMFGSSGAIPIGWDLWDRLIGGVPKGFPLIIGARPGAGKTALMVSMMDAFALGGVDTCYYTLEETRAAVTVRHIVRHCETLSLRTAIMGDPKPFLKETVAAQEVIYELPCDVVSRSWRSVHELCFDIRRRSMAGLQVAFVDFIQLIRDPETAKKGNRTQVMESITRALKDTAKETGVSIVMGSQLKKQDGPPRLNDLKESGAIEEDAAVVILLHRSSNPVGNELVAPTILDVAKNRYGPTTEFAMGFEKRRATFTEGY